MAEYTTYDQVTSVDPISNLGAARFGLALLAQPVVLGISLLWGCAAAYIGVVVFGTWTETVRPVALLVVASFTVLGAPALVARYAAVAAGARDGGLAHQLAGLHLTVLKILVSSVLIGVVVGVPLAVTAFVPGSAYLAVFLIGSGIMTLAYSIPATAVEDFGVLFGPLQAWETVKRTPLAALFFLIAFTLITAMVIYGWFAVGPIVAGLAVTSGLGMGYSQAVMSRIYFGADL